MKPPATLLQEFSFKGDWILALAQDRSIERVKGELRSQLEEKGYQSRTVSVHHLRELQEGIEGNRSRGLFNEEFYQERLAGFTFSPPDLLPEAKSLVIVAVPRPQTRVIFTWQGRSIPVIMPPTYAAYLETDRRIEGLLSTVLNPEGYRVAQTALPLKYLAVCSGLGEYGRNNICYVPAMGSFHQLAAFYTDFPCPEDSWRKPQMMERCQSCQACLNNCPTGAITSERFLVRADRCLTFHNERVGKFPAWIDASWHNCVVGCLRCQRVCPLNISFREWIEESEVFSDEETSLILDCVPQDRLPPETVKKLEKLDLIEYLDVLPRNLDALLRRENHALRSNSIGADRSS